MAAFYWEEGGDPDSEAALKSVYYWEVGTITQVNWRQGYRNTEVQKVGIKYKGEHEEVWHSCASEDYNYNTIWTFIKLVDRPPAAGAPPPAPAAAGPLGAASSARLRGT
eukprot:scaffold1581_cov127-Isochrysis_galbana.AAC.7